MRYTESLRTNLKQNISRQSILFVRSRGLFENESDHLFKTFPQVVTVVNYFRPKNDITFSRPRLQTLEVFIKIILCHFKRTPQRSSKKCFGCFTQKVYYDFEESFADGILAFSFQESSAFERGRDTSFDFSHCGGFVGRVWR